MRYCRFHAATATAAVLVEVARVKSFVSLQWLQYPMLLQYLSTFPYWMFNLYLENIFNANDLIAPCQNVSTKFKFYLFE